VEETGVCRENHRTNTSCWQSEPNLYMTNHWMIPCNNFLKDRQHNVSLVKRDRTKGQTRIYLQNTTHKTKDRLTRTPLKTGGEQMCSSRIRSSCSISDTRRVTVKRHDIDMEIAHSFGMGSCLFVICVYVYVHISLFLPECACTTIIDTLLWIFSLIYCCCVSIIIVNINTNIFLNRIHM
jgi:hypothetical protein